MRLDHRKCGRGKLGRGVAAALLALSCLLSHPAHADDADLLTKTAEHIEAARFAEAIFEAEAAADQGVVSSDLSFNRGLAYLGRAKTSLAVSGDLAQASAGFAESLQLRPGDAEAARGLEQARLLIAQDRSQKDTSPDSSNLGILERVLLAIAPLVLALLAALGSLVLSLGLVFFVGRNESRRTAGAIMTLVGSLFLVPSAALAGARASLFAEARTAVVIADSAEVVDDAGKKIALRPAFRKGTLLYLGPSDRGAAPLVGIGETGFVPLARVRLLKGAP